MRKIKHHGRRVCSTLARFRYRITRHFSTSLQRVKHYFYHPRALRMGQMVITVYLIGYCLSVLANGNDILQGTDASLWATLNGTGKKYIYAAEGILGLAGYMKTKNLLILSGLVVVSIFFNIILSIAGESA